MNVHQAIKRAEAALSDKAVPIGDEDPRWQAILGVGEYSQSDPEVVWAFIERWGQDEDPDLRMAVGLCLLEHFLGYHFELMFPRVERVAMVSARFADTFRHCRKMGQAEDPEQARRWNALYSRVDPGPAA